MVFSSQLREVWLGDESIIEVVDNNSVARRIDSNFSFQLLKSCLMTVSSCRYGSGPDRDGSAGDGPPAGSGSGSGQDTAGPDSGQHHPETRHTDGCGHHPGQHRLHGTFATQQVCGSDPTDYLTVTEGREAAGRCKESNAEVYGSVRQSDPNRFISHDALLSHRVTCCPSLWSAGSSDRPPGLPRSDQNGSVSLHHHCTGVFPVSSSVSHTHLHYEGGG